MAGVSKAEALFWGGRLLDLRLERLEQVCAAFQHVCYPLLSRLTSVLFVKTSVPSLTGACSWPLGLCLHSSLMSSTPMPSLCTRYAAPVACFLPLRLCADVQAHTHL